MKKNNSSRTDKAVQVPVYPGGRKALEQFIKDNLVYPDEAIQNKTEGRVIADYDVDVFGRVISAKIRQGIGSGCDEEALRLVRSLQYPARKYQGLRVIFHMNIVIHFRLQSPGNEFQFIYHYVPQKEKGPAS